MAGIYETKFNQSWPMLERDVLKPLKHAALDAVAKDGRQRTLAAAQALDKAMAARDAIQIARCTQALKSAAANFATALEGLARNATPAIPSDKRQYLGNYRSKLRFLGEDADDAIGALQAGTLAQIAGSALMNCLGQHKLTATTLAVLGGDALKHPLTGKSLPAATEIAKRAAAHHRTFETAIKTLTNAKATQTNVAAGKVLLTQKLDEAIFALKQIEDLTSEWKEAMNQALGGTAAPEKTVNLLKGVESLRNIAHNDQDELVTAQKLAEQIGRRS